MDAVTLFDLESSKLLFQGNDKDGINTLRQLSSKKLFWLHVQAPSLNLQKLLAAQLQLSTEVKKTLFNKMSRPRSAIFQNTILLQLRDSKVKTSKATQPTVSIRLWLTPFGLLSSSLEASPSIQLLLKQLLSPANLSAQECFWFIINAATHHFDDAIYSIDEALDDVEADTTLQTNASDILLALRQKIIMLRRYMLPQRDTIMNLLTINSPLLPESTRGQAKALADMAVRQVETMEMLRERARVLQDHLINEGVEKANNRIYVLSIFMLLFAPSMFVVSLFSINVPIPFATYKAMFWIILGCVVGITSGLLYMFKRKKWL